ncbi:potassium channel family protein [Actinomycetospora lutea]|uniref:potassium channel family protein n=1 Tax=Actinomycetospora lutea TaxID=663604 RepID=UPI002366C89E|nr:potassium channel family protein [Actinomycetospora lutea]MDD7942485.1 potassium channel family protein [Actinomycetospora lutea]
MASFLHPYPSVRPSRGRLVLVALRAVATSAVLVLAYFLLPLSSRPDTVTLVLLAVGLVALGVLIVWQVRVIDRARHPGVRALQTLTIVITAFLLLFATGYYLASQAQPGSFSELLDRVDALYFTITVFATVGFGDISPVSAGTRIVVAVQMLADLVILGFVLQAVVGAARRGMARVHSTEE